MSVEASPAPKGLTAPIVVPPDQTFPLFRRLRALCRFLMYFVGPLDVQGMENIPATGPVIIASNHRAHVDPPYLSTITRRQMYLMGKEELYTTNFAFGQLLYKLGSFPVRRGEPDRAALRLCISLLKQGQVVGIFPEGTRSTDENLLPAEKGFALIAKQTGAPIVPIALEGTQRVLPKGAKFPHRARVSITIGKPVTAQEILDAYEGDPGKDALDIIGREVMHRIDSLMRQRKKETP